MNQTTQNQHNKEFIEIVKRNKETFLSEEQKKRLELTRKANTLRKQVTTQADTISKQKNKIKQLETQLKQSTPTEKTRTPQPAKRERRRLGFPGGKTQGDHPWIEPCSGHNEDGSGCCRDWFG